MACAYLCEPGVRLWEAVEDIEAGGTSTLTLLGNTIGDVTSIWRQVVAQTRASHPVVLKWHTVGYSLAGSRAQERLVLKKVSESLGPGDLVQKSRQTGIISSIRNVSGDRDNIDLATLAQSSLSTLILLPNVHEDMRPILVDSLSRAGEGLTATAMRDILPLHPDLLLCRAVESDTHFVVQFVGSGEAVEALLSELQKLNVAHIQEEDVAAFINR